MGGIKAIGGHSRDAVSTGRTWIGCCICIIGGILLL